VFRSGDLIGDNISGTTVVYQEAEKSLKICIKTYSEKM
jgi:hypothetical protein